jgi:1-aminocyclopropane-1-carboxylate deaminase/D-cysteine desulfhydrase-like pyridoxal-dependent ACC family enzyme
VESATYNARLPRIGSYPTRVQHADPAVGNLWIKRDDLTSADYGGNKVRKLDAIFEAARGLRHVLTVGAAGSHFVLALTLHGVARGLKITALYTEQPGSQAAQANMRAALALGLTGLSSHAPLDLAHFARLMAAPGNTFLPLGGSNVVGSASYVSAGLELAEQVRAHELPEPHELYVAQGSGGTAAGLAVGLAQAGLGTQVVGVAVSKPHAALAYSAQRLARKLAKRNGVDPTSVRLRTDSSFVGLGYGHEVWGAPAAREIAQALGFRTDATYTEKALVAALARARARPDLNVLYWHTLSARSGADVLAGVPKGEQVLVPARLAKLFVPMR